MWHLGTGLMVDLAVLGLQLDSILKVFSNLEDFVISIRLELLARSPLLPCSCTLHSALHNTEKSHCRCDREAGGFHFSQITVYRSHLLSQPPCCRFYDQDVPLLFCCSHIAGQQVIKESVD